MPIYVPFSCFTRSGWLSSPEYINLISVDFPNFMTNVDPQVQKSYSNAKPDMNKYTANQGKFEE